MSRVTQSEVQAWLDAAKLTVTTLDQDLLSQLEEETLVQLTSSYDVSTWVDAITTPKIVRVIIAKMYASFYIDRVYSDNQNVGNDYAARLMANATMLLTGLTNGSIDIPNVTATNPASSPSFFPTDASSAQDSTLDNPELGGPYFSLGRVF